MDALEVLEVGVVGCEVGGEDGGDEDALASGVGVL